MDTEKTKKIILIAVIAIGILGVVGAGVIIFNSIRNQSTTINSNSSTATIRVWGLWETEAIMKTAIDEYKKIKPNITISYSNREQISSNYKSTLKSRLAEGNSQQVPDIFMIHNTWTEDFSKYMSPIPTGIYTQSQYQNTFFPSVADSFTYKNNSYALPIGIDGLGVYYNKKLLTDKGFTLPEANWDQFKDQAKKLTRFDANGNIIVGGVGMGTMNNVDFSYEILSMLMLQNGATMTDSTTGLTTFGTDSASASALKFYTDFATVDKGWNKTLPRDITMFAEGRLAMMFAPLWRADSIKKANPTLEFDIAPVPQLSNFSGTGRIDYADFWGYSVSSISTYKTESWDFLKFLSSKDTLKILNVAQKAQRVSGEFYPRVDMVTELANVPYTDAYSKMMTTAKTWKMFDKESVSQIFKTDIDASVSSSSLSTGTASSILQGIATKVDAIIKNKNAVVSSSSANSTLAK
ncbi:MAG: extracellular solute-binding protein [bacterium]